VIESECVLENYEGGKHCGEIIDIKESNIYNNQPIDRIMGLGVEDSTFLSAP